MSGDTMKAGTTISGSNSTSPVGGPSFYDDEEIFTRYQQMRRQPETPSRVLEQPKVLEYLGDLRGRTLLDLGCGDAWIGRYALQQGASSYLGLDASLKMLAAARRMLAGSDGQVRQQNLESWCGSDLDKFDVVVSRLALHYIRRLGQLLQVAHHHLMPEGLFVFSIEHPLLTSTCDRRHDDDIATGWEVHSYFREGDRQDRWLGAVVSKQHRTLETYIEQIIDKGFSLSRFSEGFPTREHFADDRHFEKRLEVPMCAIFRCVRRPG